MKRKGLWLLLFLLLLGIAGTVGLLDRQGRATELLDWEAPCLVQRVDPLSPGITTLEQAFVWLAQDPGVRKKISGENPAMEIYDTPRYGLKLVFEKRVLREAIVYMRRGWLWNLFVQRDGEDWRLAQLFQDDIQAPTLQEVIEHLGAPSWYEGFLILRDTWTMFLELGYPERGLVIEVVRYAPRNIKKVGENVWIVPLQPNYRIANITCFSPGDEAILMRYPLYGKLREWHGFGLIEVDESPY